MDAWMNEWMGVHNALMINNRKKNGDGFKYVQHVERIIKEEIINGQI